MKVVRIRTQHFPTKKGLLLQPSSAESEGFEPPEQLPVHRISSAARSTTPATFLGEGEPTHMPYVGSPSVKKPGGDVMKLRRCKI